MIKNEKGVKTLRKSVPQGQFTLGVNNLEPGKYQPQVLGTGETGEEAGKGEPCVTLMLHGVDGSKNIPGWSKAGEIKGMFGEDAFSEVDKDTEELREDVVWTITEQDGKLQGIVEDIV